jgi:hypothetical protein
MRSSRVLLVCFAILISVVTTGAAIAQECVDCHNDPAATRETSDGKSVSVHVDQALFDKSIHSSIGCSGCHGDISEYPHPTAVAKVDCAQCHADAATEFDKSIHATAAAAGKEDMPTCISCHGKHDILPKSDMASKTNRFRIPETCASCHGKTTVTQAHPIPPPAEISKYFDSVHGIQILRQRSRQGCAGEGAERIGSLFRLSWSARRTSEGEPGVHHRSRQGSSDLPQVSREDLR